MRQNSYHMSTGLLVKTDLGYKIYFFMLKNDSNENKATTLIK